MLLYLKEEETYTKEDLEKKLDLVSIINKEKFLNQALTSRVIIPIFEKSKGIKEEARFEIQKYKINFVGILKFESVFIIVYPKYIRNVESDINNSNFKFKEIIKVIDKFNSANIFETDKLFRQEESFFDLQLKVWKDFIFNGIYSNEIETIELNGEGEFSWEETISGVLPYLNNGLPVYLDSYTKKRENELNNLARQIHKAILSEIQENFGLISDIVGLKRHFFETNGLENLGDVDYLVRAMENELRIQNITLKQNTLKDMIQYVELQKMKSTNSMLYLYGTTSFNLVWEDICKKVYKDHLNEEISSFPTLKIQGVITNGDGSHSEVNYTNREKIKDIVDKPIWSKLTENHLQVQASKGSLLDVLHLNLKNQSIDIYDGKYYDIEFADNGIKGQPGVEDVIKQYFYQLAYKKLAQLNNLSFKNTFVIPMDDFVEDKGQGVELYKVKISYLSDLLLEDIVVIGRDCSTFYKQYLNNN